MAEGQAVTVNGMDGFVKEENAEILSDNEFFK
jgi:hypothetical protein